MWIPTKKVCCLNAECLRQTINYIDPGSINAAFERADVRPVELCPVGKLFLREPGGPAMAPQIFGEDLSYTHPQEKREMQSILPRSILYIGRRD